MTYSSSLTDPEWEIVEPLLLELLPQKLQTRPPDWTKREILDGIFYQLKNGCNWGDLPKDLPPVLVRVPLRRETARGRTAIQRSIGITNNGETSE